MLKCPNCGYIFDEEDLVEREESESTEAWGCIKSTTYYSYACPNCGDDSYYDDWMDNCFVDEDEDEEEEEDE